MPSPDALRRYAELLVQIGVNLPEGGKLQVNSPLEAAPLAREIVRAAYRAGALAAEVRYGDTELARALYEEGREEALDYVPPQVPSEGLAKIADGWAFLSLTGSDPDALAGLDAGRIARHSKTLGLANKPVSEKMMAFEAAWSIGAFATPAWARKVFPEFPEAEATEALWEAIFQVSRADQPDPVAAWQAHIARLGAVRDALNGAEFSAVHLKTRLGTDLTVGLAPGHIWAGVEDQTASGHRIIPNLPTDEVFTAPDPARVSGVAVASKPLSVRGSVIEGIRMRFEEGRVVEASAQSGEDVLQALLDTDEGARRLGEIALVEGNAPVAQTGRLFYNTLFDENAASHIALGRAYSFNLRAGGGNDSLIHVDWMIGTADADVDGLSATGERTPLMRAGRWVIGV